MREVLLFWSGGKDAAWTLHVLQEQCHVRVVSLLTTIDGHSKRVPLQGARVELMELQAEAVGLPLQVVELPPQCPNVVYERLVGAALDRARQEGVDKVAFGDLHLDDVRRYRETLFDKRPIRPIFPLWNRLTAELAQEMIDGGLRARITCVDGTKLGAEVLGREFDRPFLESLSPDVDPCGERGEFHTFVYDGPMFLRPLEIANGERWRDGVHELIEPLLVQPIDGTLDLHTFSPRDVGTLVPDYVQECRRRDILQLRIVHGKGSGVLRERVHALLRRTPGVRSFRLADEAAGSWGATLVELDRWSDEERSG